MPRAKAKYTAGLTWGDFKAYCENLEIEYGLRVEVSLKGFHAASQGAQLEVSLFDASLALSGPIIPLVTARGAMLYRGEGQPSNIIHVASQAWAIYLDEPWLWTVRHRTRVLQLGEG